MSANLQPNEREVVKLAKYFDKKAQQLIKEGKLTEEHKKVSEACKQLISQLHSHAENRAMVREKRETLGKLIKDNALCPQCQKSSHLKFVRVEKNEQGWKCNRYRCRNCNIQFTWNRPNNPWDMISFIEHYLPMLRSSMQDKSQEEKQEMQAMVVQMEESLEKFKSIVDTTNKEFDEMEARDKEMTDLISQFRKHLLIEKIKLEP